MRSKTIIIFNVNQNEREKQKKKRGKMNFLWFFIAILFFIVISSILIGTMLPLLFTFLQRFFKKFVFFHFFLFFSLFEILSFLFESGEIENN